MTRIVAGFGLGMLVVLLTLPLRAAVLEVGEGRPFAHPQAALAAVKAGDEIRVHPLSDGKPYPGVTLRLNLPGLTLRGMGEKPVLLSAKGVDLSGRGPVPRAVIQLDPSAQGALIDHFEIVNGHNDDGNAAGIRVNQANDVTVRRCDLHHNDNGIFSNPGGEGEVRRLRLEENRIHHNGAAKGRGNSHNLYLAGAGVYLLKNEVHDSLDGHNLKSRTHLLLAEENLFRHARQREIDLVDSRESAVAGSDVLLRGNRIIKGHKAKNHEVIYFGSDGSHQRRGTLYLLNNVLETPFTTAMIHLDGPEVAMHLDGNRLVTTSAPKPGRLLRYSGGAAEGRVVSGRNSLSPGFSDALPSGTPAGLPLSLTHLEALRRSP
ncbi:MAG: right-handed parallel beta-helix repeat-containing protein [Magnetococcales bacterium]|nr:right-handed parallel beta-helix repeat-containing protein [Magnetococcales bacterium]